LSTGEFKGDQKVNASKKENQAKLIIVEPENQLLQEIPASLTSSPAPIEKKIERDWSDLRAAGLDYGDFVDHLLELIAAVEEGGKAKSAFQSKPESKITATRLNGPGTNVLKLKLLIE
jgi:hypothetical protein